MTSIISFDVPMTPEKFASIHQKAHLDGNTTSGTLSNNDVDLNWQYIPGTLSIQVTSLKSMAARFAPHSLVRQKIVDLLNQA